MLPRVFGDLLPAPGGYRAFGIPWEEGRELPVGFSKKTVGFPRITQTCAICHAASYRTSPDAAPVIVPSGPSHTTNAMAFLDFLEAAANDPRWSGDGMLPEMTRYFDLGIDDKLIYRYLIIPLAKDRVLEQAQDFAWMHAHERPAWGPGRDGPFNLTKFNLLGLPGRRDGGQCGLPVDLERRDEGEHLAELGRGDAGSAGGLHRLGARDRGAGRDGGRRHGDAPRVPAGEAAAAISVPGRRGAGGRGGAGLAAGVRYCHAPGGAYFGRVTPIEEIGTDRERFDTWTAEHAATTNAKALELGVVRKAMVKDVGYANQPLDGIWLRAPYLHNGSVPSLTALLAPPEERPASFWRGCDIYDPVAVGFRSTPPDDDCPNLFLLDTGLRGEGNGGHVYGTDLPAAEKAALVEYLKTL